MFADDFGIGVAECVQPRRVHKRESPVSVRDRDQIAAGFDRGGQHAQTLIGQSRTDHPADVIVGEERFYAILLMTDGQWTDPVGTGMNAANDPAPTAGDLYNNDDVPTYVVAIGDAAGKVFTDQIAAFTAGSTDSGSPLVRMTRSALIAPLCSSGM